MEIGAEGLPVAHPSSGQSAARVRIGPQGSGIPHVSDSKGRTSRVTAQDAEADGDLRGKV